MDWIFTYVGSFVDVYVWSRLDWRHISQNSGLAGALSCVRYSL